jgi:predicted nucleotidyltransferase
MVMELQSVTKESILDELLQLKPVFCEKYGVQRIGLFGSFVRGDNRSDSDIDVVVECASPDLFNLVHIKETLEQDFRRPVDVIPYSPFMNGYLKDRINKEAVYV